MKLANVVRLMDLPDLYHLYQNLCKGVPFLKMTSAQAVKNSNNSSTKSTRDTRHERDVMDMSMLDLKHMTQVRDEEHKSS